MTGTDAQDGQWGRELAAAIEDPAGYLGEQPSDATPGSYWPRATTDDTEVERAYDTAVAHALRALEDLLAVRPRATGAQRTDAILRAQRREALLLAAVDRALADPEAGYLKRLRARRSALLRERVAAGTPVADLALEHGVSTQRIHALLKNNRQYVSADRQMALEALREQAAASRAAAKAARDAERAKAAEARRAARVTEGRALQARLDGGASREELMAELGVSRQRLANLLAAAAGAGTGVAA